MRSPSLPVPLSLTVMTPSSKTPAFSHDALAADPFLSAPKDVSYGDLYRSFRNIARAPYVLGSSKIVLVLATYSLNRSTLTITTGSVPLFSAQCSTSVDSVITSPAL